MVERILGQINNLIIEIDPDITIDFGEVETIRFNKSYLESIFLNLFTNEMKYKSSDRKLKISIQMKDIGNKYQMSFEDKGFGLYLI